MKNLRAIGNFIGPCVPFLLAAGLCWAMVLDLGWFIRGLFFVSAVVFTWGGVIMRECRFRANLLAPFVIPAVILELGFAAVLGRMPTGIWTVDVLNRGFWSYTPPTAYSLVLGISLAILVRGLKKRRDLALTNPMFRAHHNPLLTIDAARYFERLALGLSEGYAEIRCVRDAAAEVPEHSPFAPFGWKIRSMVEGDWKLSEAMEYVLLSEPVAQIASYFRLYVYGVEAKRACGLAATEIRQLLGSPQRLAEELTEAKR